MWYNVRKRIKSSSNQKEKIMNTQNILYGKTIIWNGDSICAGSRHTGAWADRIAEKNSMICKNYAIGGGTIAEGLPIMKSGNKRHSVSETLDLMYSEFPCADYLVIEGGTNDADLLGLVSEGVENTKLGSLDPFDFSGNYDKNTFCGALESIFFRALGYWNEKKILYVVAQKMGMSKEEFVNRRIYFDEAVKICEKWGIPYIDLWKGCYLNPYLKEMYNSEKTPEENRAENVGYYIDGQHLTAKGYDLTADILEKKLISL